MNKELEYKPVMTNVRIQSRKRMSEGTNRFHDSLDTKLRHLDSTASGESDESGIVEGESIGNENIPARRSIFIFRQPAGPRLEGGITDRQMRLQEAFRNFHFPLEATPLSQFQTHQAGL